MKRFESGFKKIVEKGQYMKHQPIRVFWKGTQYGKMVEMGPKGKQSLKGKPAINWAQWFKGQRAVSIIQKRKPV